MRSVAGPPARPGVGARTERLPGEHPQRLQGGLARRLIASFELLDQHGRRRRILEPGELRDGLETVVPLDALVMQPGPANRGVEIDALVADDPRSVINEQVANGVAVRMAVLYLLLGSSDGRAA